MPRRPRWNWWSHWVTYRGWQPAVAALGDDKRCACVGFWFCVCVLGGTGGECPVAWAAGFLDQQSWHAVSIRYGTKPISSRVDCASGPRPLYIKGVILFLLVMYDYPTPTIDPLTFEGALNQNTIISILILKLLSSNSYRLWHLGCSRISIVSDPCSSDSHIFIPCC